MHGFSLKVEQMVPGVMCVRLSGELDLNRAYTFDEEVRAVEAMGPDAIVLDLRRVTFVDSAGLARIVAARRRSLRAGRRLVVVRGCAAVQRLFALTAMDHPLEMVSEPEAILVG
jgi:anti-anti-sigma factor